MRLFVLLFTLVLLALATPARADTRSVPNSSVRLRIERRTDTVFVVEVTNPSNAPAPFDSIGLYFLPDSGEPVQRLGVVSAPRMATAGVAAQEIITVAPHQTVQLVLTAYCLDEHRGGPSPKTKYHLAGRRIPTALREALAGAAQSANHDHLDPQRAVWAVRAAMPVTLLGEVRLEVPRRRDAAPWAAMSDLDTRTARRPVSFAY